MKSYTNVMGMEVINDKMFLTFYRNCNPLDSYFICTKKDFIITNGKFEGRYKNNMLVKDMKQ